MKIIKTPMMKRYWVKLAIRVSIFVGVLIQYLLDKERLYEWMIQPLYMGVTPMHVLWLVFMVMMIQHIFPMKRLTMALRKSEEKEYVEIPEYSRLELLEFVQQQNVRAWIVMLAWLIPNGIFGILYACGVLKDIDLMMLTVFYFLCDYICILFFCPFQTCIMKNKCCVNCRIFDWGHFMMFTPMLFIHGFYTLSLFFTSCVVLIRWEIVYAKHPERFWSSSNQRLQCAHCEDKICQMKKGLAASVKKKKK